MRADTGLNESYILEIANKVGVKTVTVTAYCQHHKSDDQYCIECDNGYVDDVHKFYNPRGDIAYSNLNKCYLAGLSDCHTFVRYIPWRFQRKIDAWEKAN